MSVPQSTPGGTPPGKGQTIGLDFDSPDFLADPYPLYHQLRAADPVHRSPWGDRYLARYADVNETPAIIDARTRTSSPGLDVECSAHFLFSSGATGEMQTSIDHDGLQIELEVKGQRGELFAKNPVLQQMVSTSEPPNLVSSANTTPWVPPVGELIGFRSIDGMNPNTVCTD